MEKIDSYATWLYNRFVENELANEVLETFFIRDALEKHVQLNLRGARLKDENHHTKILIRSIKKFMKEKYLKQKNPEKLECIGLEVRCLRQQ